MSRRTQAAVVGPYHSPGSLSYRMPTYVMSCRAVSGGREYGGGRAFLCATVRTKEILRHSYVRKWRRRKDARRRHYLIQKRLGANPRHAPRIQTHVAADSSTPSCRFDSQCAQRVPHLAHVVYRKQIFLAWVVGEETDERAVLWHTQALFQSARDTPRPAAYGRPDED